MTLVSTAATLSLRPMRPGTPWVRPFDLLTTAGALTAIGLGLAAWPDRAPLVGALLTSAAACAALGIVRDVLVLRTAVPALVCAAWLVGIVDVVRGEALWFTVPVALALFAIASIGRSAHHRLGGRGTPTPFVVVEGAADVALLLPPLVELVTGGLVYGAMVIAFGTALAGWGVVTRVRRRLVVGIVGVVVGVVLLVGVPLVEALPGARASGTAIWVGILGAGVVVIAIAGALERGRATARRALSRIDALTAGWE